MVEIEAFMQSFNSPDETNDDKYFVSFKWEGIELDISGLEARLIVERAAEIRGESELDKWNSLSQAIQEHIGE